MEKLVLGQLNVVFCANTRRWKKSCNLFASKHLLALEKVLGSWKSLANKILKTKGDTDAMSKAVVVETIHSPTDTTTTTDSRDDEKAEELVVETIGNAPDEVDPPSYEKAEELEQERKEQEEKERKAKEEEAERLRIEKEEEERKAKEAEEARIRKEKQEELKKEQAANKAKMDKMFGDGDKPDSEFPWEDDE